MTEHQLPRGFAGEAKTDKPVLELGPLAPWHATVKVVPLHLRRAVTFQVIAEWTGPPAPYMPPDDRPGLRQDIYNTRGDLQLAKAIARLAAQQLGQGIVPDLREHAEDLRQRLAAGPYG
jgi:hypothetical protein